MILKTDRGLNAIILYLFLYFLLNLFVILIGYYLGDYLILIGDFLSPLPDTVVFLFLFLLQEIVLLGILLMSFYYMRDANFKKFRGYTIEYFRNKFLWKGWKYFFKYSVGLFLVYIVFTGIVATLLEQTGADVPGFFGEQKVAGFLGSIPLTNFRDYFILFMAVAVIGPIVEEIIYRGFITQKLINRTGAFYGIVFSSFIFSFVHFEWSVFGNLFILALILSYIYHKTGSMCYSFLFHFIVNFMGIVGIMVGVG